MSRIALHADARPSAAPNALAIARSLLHGHLAAALDHCEAIGGAEIALGAAVDTGANGRAILRQNRELAAFVADLRARELAVALRLTQAVVVADRVAGIARAHAPLAALVRSGAAVVVDAGSRVAGEQQDMSAFAFLMSRRLLQPDATALPELVSAGDHYALLGVAPLADVCAFLETALRTVDGPLAD